MGDKLLSRAKIDQAIDRILNARAQGLSQQEAAQAAGVDRTFVSRLESLGEIRRGQRLAVIGFPLGNTAQLQRVCREEGVEFTLLMTDEERWRWVQEKSSMEVLNEILRLIAYLHQFDALVMIGSDLRLRLADALVGRDMEVVGINIGASPIHGDRTLDPEELRQVLRALKGSARSGRSEDPAQRRP